MTEVQHFIGHTQNGIIIIIIFIIIIIIIIIIVVVVIIVIIIIHSSTEFSNFDFNDILQYN
jgi:hypothetical protein